VARTGKQSMTCTGSLCGH